MYRPMRKFGLVNRVLTIKIKKNEQEFKRFRLDASQRR